MSSANTPSVLEEEAGRALLDAAVSAAGASPSR